MRNILFSALVLVSAVQASSLVETALAHETQYELSGTFAKYDFEPLGDDGAFDWAFTTASGASYQLQGNEPTEDNVFGWKGVDIEAPAPAWYMFQLNGDVDNDGSAAFDWVMLSVNVDNKAAYKLAGVNAEGKFEYSSKLNIRYEVTDTLIETGKVTLRSNDVEDDAYLDVKHGAGVSFSGDSRGKNISPHLEWTSVPGVQSYALEMIDLDYQNSKHWTVINIPVSTTSLIQGVSIQSLTNDYGVNGYTGPFPPSIHRYQFTIYAVNKTEVTTMSEAKENTIDSATITPKFKW